MFDFSWSEILLIGVVALVVIGPKDLPRVLRTVGQWTDRARGGDGTNGGTRTAAGHADDRSAGAAGVADRARLARA